MCEVPQKSNLRAFKMVEVTVFNLLKSAKIDFTYNHSDRKLLNFHTVWVKFFFFLKLVIFTVISFEELVTLKQLFLVKLHISDYMI